MSSQKKSYNQSLCAHKNHSSHSQNTVSRTVESDSGKRCEIGRMNGMKIKKRLSTVEIIMEQKI